MSAPSDAQRMEKIVSLCKRRGFIFQSSEIYGGLNGCWDYGPLGVELKRNLKNYWWRVMVHERDDVVGMDGAILMNRVVWKASGHEDTFSDPMVDCLLTGKRFRADQIDEQSGWVVSFSGAVDFEAFQKLQQEKEAPERSSIWSEIELAPHLRGIFANYSSSFDLDSRSGYVQLSDPNGQMKSLELLIKRGTLGTSSLQPFLAMEIGGDPKSFRWSSNRGVNRAIKLAQDFYRKRGVTNPIVIAVGVQREEHSKRFNPENGALVTGPRAFNLMFKTYVGATEDDSSVTYLRPETAQSIFVQFKNILEVSRKKLPFGIAQIGKAFRNEINPRNFTFRSREFEQMELEYFCRAEEGMKLLDYWLEERLKFYESIGIPTAKLHARKVPDEERAFYSKGTYDIEYDFPFGRHEVEGVAYRTDYDLSQHQKASGKSLEYFDEETKQRFLPHVVEPSAGVDRSVLALICEAYSEDEAPDERGKMEMRVVLRFHPRIAPIKCAVFPLLKNKEPLVTKAKEIVALLRPHMHVFYDETGAIGRRYRRQDEIGTPFGVTVDFETLGEKNPDLRDTVTLRDRDSMKQERVTLKDLPGILVSRIS